MSCSNSLSASSLHCSHILQRLPNVVELMQQPGGDLSSCLAVRQGYALALRQSLMSPQAVDNLEEGPTGRRKRSGMIVNQRFQQRKRDWNTLSFCKHNYVFSICDIYIFCIQSSSLAKV
jgi:hypothetical protein